MSGQDKIYQMITDIIVEKIEKSIENKEPFSWTKTWEGGHLTPMNLTTGKPYTGVNVLLLSDRFSNPYFLTYKQLKSIGGSLKKEKGIKSTPIVFWNTFEKNKFKKNKTKEQKKKDTVWFLKYFNVYNVEQCEGIEHKRLDELKTEIKNTNKFENIVEFDTMVKNYGIDITHNEQRAYYSPGQDFINMPIKESFKSTGNYYNTLAHELTHSTGHEARLNRKEISEMTIAAKNDGYAIEECVAEIGASFMSTIFNLNISLDNNVEYLKGWIYALKNDTKLLSKASSRAQNATDYLLKFKEA